jgi:hypothetical protein
MFKIRSLFVCLVNVALTMVCVAQLILQVGPPGGG